MSEQNEDVVDSPSDCVAEHIRRYVDTDSKDGHIWGKKSTTLLLTTKGRKSETKARTVTAAEKPRLWEIMPGIWSDYDDYQKKNRDIPAVVLERI